MASSTMKAAAHTPKQHKAKRSLRKTPKRQNLADKESLAIDLSKPEMDAIFAGLYTGQLENPQMAANKVYALALDALEKTLCEGLDEFCRDIQHNGSSNANPFAPWISKFIPKDQKKINSIRDDIKSKIGKAKNTVTTQLTNAFEADAAENNMLGKKGQMTANAIREVFSHADDIKLPGISHYLSKDRLTELADLIKLPIQDDGVRRYTISNLPDKYRFSFGKTSSNTSADAPQTVQNTVSFSCGGDEASSEKASDDAQPNVDELSTPIHIDENSTQNIPQNEVLPINHDSGLQTQSSEVCSESHSANSPILPPLNEILPDIPVNISPEMLGAIKEGAEDCVAAANEVTEIMKEMAVHITEAAMQAYREEQFKPSLSDILRDDPETENDAELLAFIQSLECDPDPDDSSADSIDNDELKTAFDKLLDDFDN